MRSAGGVLADLNLRDDKYRITLITGDVITLSAVGEGRYTATVDPAVRPDGSVPSIDISGTNERLYAFPKDVLPFLAAGRLDKELFNIFYLAANGYGDAARGLLPVIVEYSEQLSSSVERQRASALPASDVAHVLESIDAVALQVSKSNAQTFWAGLRGDAKAAGTKAATLDASVTKLWLDRKVEVQLNESVPLIGAPEAWAAGYDGTGVKVAVLDTGIDATHPDVAGKVVASESFIPGLTVVDGHGHGTHVAATIAGTGAAENGTYKGVAPGAALAIGKVCNNQGSCPESSIIDGMEWAAGEQGADVVSMSLGGGPTDGTDPKSQAVNRLTEQTGALFVIAAGNDGPGQSSVTSPGTADAALTVAAVNKSDQLAGFSGRGPRVGDHAMKPDIAAPGVGIVAARAAGTSLGAPVNDHYTRLNGTSMATPHVAGAAAILAQRHPGWTAGQLKPALMSTSKDAGYTVYQQGAGRVDVGRAVRQQVFASTANVDFKLLRPPFDDDTVTGAIKYTNLAEQAITLTMAPHLQTTAGAPVPDGALISPSSLTVPANGTATLEVRLDPASLTPNAYTGGIVATGPNGVRLATPVGLTLAPQVHKVEVTLNLRQKDVDPWVRRGECAVVRLLGVDGEAEGFYTDSFDVGGLCWNEREPRSMVNATFFVPSGTYFAVAETEWTSNSRRQYAQLFNSEFNVSADSELVLDADEAVPITTATPEPSEPEEQIFQYLRTTAGGALWNYFGIRSYADQVGWVTPTEVVTKGTFYLSPHWVLGAPRVTMSISKPERHDLHPFAKYPGQALPFTGEQTRPLVYAGLGTPEDFARVDAAGKLVLLRPEDPEGISLSSVQLQHALDAGAAGVLFHPGKALLGLQHFGLAASNVPQIPFVVLPAAEAEHLIDVLSKDKVEITVRGTPPGESPYLYVLKPYAEGRIPSRPHYVFTKQNLAVFDWHVHADQPRRTEASWSTFRPFEGTFFFMISAPEFSIPRSLPVFAGPLYADAAQFAGADWPMEQGIYGLHAPTRQDVHWNARPVAPGTFKAPSQALWLNWGLCSGCRQGDTFYPASLLATLDQQSAGLAGAIAPFGGIHLYRNGEEIAPAPPVGGAFAAYNLPAEPARYRLTVDQAYRYTGEIDDKIHSAWEFTSSRVTSDETPAGNPCLGSVLVGSTQPCRPEPLLFLRYDADVGLDNAVRAGRIDQIIVSVYRQAASGPRIAGLKLWASFDNGARWEPLKVKARHDGEFEVKVTYPEVTTTTGAVSLKAEAWDAVGNRVEQTVLQAYDLREGDFDPDD